MKIEQFKQELDNKLSKNFKNCSAYFDTKIEVFFELETLIIEINKCLILELYRAAITLTNHLLERILKLALIYNEVGIRPSPVEHWNSIFEEPNRKYSSIDLGKSIELCENQELISTNEKIILFDRIRVLMRNGFSHADSSKILAKLPDETSIIEGNLNDPNVLKEVSVNQKILPFIQEINIANFTNQTAKNYFDFVFKLISSIEKRLIMKQI